MNLVNKYTNKFGMYMFGISAVHVPWNALTDFRYVVVQDETRYFISSTGTSSYMPQHGYVYTDQAPIANHIEGEMIFSSQYFFHDHNEMYDYFKNNRSVEFTFQDIRIRLNNIRITCINTSHEYYNNENRIKLSFKADTISIANGGTNYGYR